MRKPIKWTLIGLGIFTAVVIVAVIIIFAGLFVSAGVSAIKEVSTPETKTLTAVEGPQKVITGQEFIYNGIKIVLTKYEIVPTNIDKNLLWVYLYVENIDSVPHEHICSEEFVIYDKGRKDGILISVPGVEEGKKAYNIGSYDKLNPSEICEGWTSYYIEPEWKSEDIEIHFEPLFGGTGCIWLLK